LYADKSRILYVELQFLLHYLVFIQASLFFVFDSLVFFIFLSLFFVFLCFANRFLVSFLMEVFGEVSDLFDYLGYRIATLILLEMKLSLPSARSTIAIKSLQRDEQNFIVKARSFFLSFELDHLWHSLSPC